jgi:hypothetical protein
LYTDQKPCNILIGKRELLLFPMREELGYLNAKRRESIP